MTNASRNVVLEAGPAQPAPGQDTESRRALERSLQDARDNVELLRLYAKSIVRMLEHCEAEVAALRLRTKVPDRLRQTPNIMDLSFVRADVDRLVGETHAQLARVHRGLRQLERKA